MATYLRQEVEQYTRSVIMEIDFNLFSDRQIKNIVKQVKNGSISTGRTMPSAVARWLIKKYPMPHFRFSRWYSSWKDNHIVPTYIGLYTPRQSNKQRMDGKSAYK